MVIGGLAGGVLAAYVYCRIKKVPFLDYFDLCAPSIAIAQGFGRIGCFMAGCCYGKETSCPIGITFTHSDFAPNHVKLIPTQLISSGLNFLNMVFLLILAKKVGKKGVVAASYMITYSVGRFVIEFFRNDDRGTILGLSTSQFFSVIIFVAGVLFLAWAILHKEKEEVLVETVSDDKEEKDGEEV